QSLSREYQMSDCSKFVFKALFLVCLVQFNYGGLTNAQVQTLKQPAVKAAAAEKTARPETPPDYSQEAMVIEQIKLGYRFEKDGTGERDYTLRVRVQSEAALERFGQLVFPYTSANEKLDVDYIRVRKPDGTIINAEAGDM